MLASLPKSTCEGKEEERRARFGTNVVRQLMIWDFIPHHAYLQEGGLCPSLCLAWHVRHCFTAWQAKLWWMEEKGHQCGEWHGASYLTVTSGDLALPSKTSQDQWRRRATFPRTHTCLKEEEEGVLHPSARGNFRQQQNDMAWHGMASLVFKNFFCRLCCCTARLLPPSQARSGG